MLPLQTARLEWGLKRRPNKIKELTHLTFQKIKYLKGVPTQVGQFAMDVQQILTQSPLRNFTYMIPCSDSSSSKDNDWLCVDPYDGEEIEHWLTERKGILKGILNTHEHWDHIRGNQHLQQRFGCPTYLHIKAQGKVEGITHFLQDGDSLTLSPQKKLKALYTPGHTFASLTYVLEEKGKALALFTGDTLFNAGVGNCHNGGDPKILYQTISQIYYPLPEHLLIYPGHEYLGNNLRFTLSREPHNKSARELLEFIETWDWSQKPYVTTLGEEKQINTFLRLGNSEIIAHLEADISHPEQVFLELRKKRDEW